MKQAVIATSRGSIRVRLFDAECPRICANFEKLAEEKFYDGQKWHRVIKDFMIQGGNPLTKADNSRYETGGPGYQIDCEIRPELKHVKGALSMAHAGTCKHGPGGERISGKCSNGSQFFITHLATPHLDGVHTVFGQVVEGQDVVDQIQADDDILSIRVSSLSGE